MWFFFGNLGIIFTSISTQHVLAGERDSGWFGWVRGHPAANGGCDFWHGDWGIVSINCLQVKWMCFHVWRPVHRPDLHLLWLYSYAIFGEIVGLKAYVTLMDCDTLDGRYSVKLTPPVPNGICSIFQPTFYQTEYPLTSMDFMQICAVLTT